MAPEIVTFVFSNVVLAAVAIMAIAGLLGAVGGVRFASCPHCAKWTVLGTGDTTARDCLRCRHPLHHGAGHEVGHVGVRRSAARERHI